MARQCAFMPAAQTSLSGLSDATEDFTPGSAFNEWFPFTIVRSWTAQLLQSSAFWCGRCSSVLWSGPIFDRSLFTCLITKHIVQFCCILWTVRPFLVVISVCNGALDWRSSMLKGRSDVAMKMLVIRLNADTAASPPLLPWGWLSVYLNEERICMGRHSDGMGGHCGVVAYDGGSDPLHRSASGSYPSSPAWGMESCSRQSFAVHNVAACTHRGRNLFIEINGCFFLQRIKSCERYII